MSRSILLLLPILLLAPRPAAAQRFTPVAPPVMTGSNQNSGLNDIAYNDKQGVYLQVWGHPVVYGRFLNASGAAIGSGPFVIAQQSPSDAMPRVEYSSGSIDDVFLVRFTSELNKGQYLYVRTVRYTANGPSMGPTQLVMGAGTEIARAGGLAFNPARRQFLLTWESPSGGWEVYGQLWQLSGAADNPSITAVTSILNISAMNNAQGTPNVAYDWEHDKYLVAFRGEHPNSALIKGSWARLLSFDSNNAATKSGVIELSSGNGEPAEQNVLYMPGSNSFLTYWTDITQGRDLSGRVVSSAGAVASAIYPILATSGNEGAADGAYSPSTGTVMIGAMREQTKYIQGVELNGSGVVGEFFQATTAMPSGGLESLFPHVSAGANGRFGVSYVNTYQYVWFELLQGIVSGGGDDTPPPPAPCTYTLSSSSQGFAANGGVGGFTVNTGSTCAWTATSNAGWLVPTSSSTSGTGSKLIVYNVAANSTSSQRTATITAGGRTFTVTQAAGVVALFTRNERKRADFNRDGRSDLLWLNTSTGQVAAWLLDGVQLKVEAGLSHKMPDVNWQIVGTGDFNADEKPDIVWWHKIYGFVGVWYMDGLNVIGSVSLSTPRVADTAWKVAGVGDMNGDSRPDILWQHDSGPLVLWAMNGVNVLSATPVNGDASMTTDRRWRVAAIGDLNSDGHLDLIWRHEHGWVAAWFMTNLQVSGVWSLDPNAEFDLAWRIVGAADINLDGRHDILLQDATNGAVVVWYMDGRTRVQTLQIGTGTLGGPSWRIVGPK